MTDPTASEKIAVPHWDSDKEIIYWPTRYELKELFNKYIRPIGIGDLRVVQQEILRYEAEEIAHIENILKGEKKSREHRSLQRTEETFFYETEETVETEIEYEKGKKKLKTVTHTKFCPEPNSERIRIKQVIKYQWTGQRWKEILPRAPPERFNCETGEPISYHPSGKTKNRYVAFLAAAIVFSVLGYTSQNNLFYLLGVGSLLVALVIYIQGPSEEDMIPIDTEIPVEEAKALEKIDILLKNAVNHKESGELSAEKAELLKALELSTEYGFIEKTKLIKEKLDDLARREKELEGT